VEGRGEHDERERQDQVQRLIQQLAQALGGPVVEEEPGVERDEAREDREDDGRPEQRAEDRGDPADHARRDEGRLELQGEELVLLLDLRARSVGPRQDPQGSKLLLDQHLDAVRIQAALDDLADLGGDLVGCSAAVGSFGDQVEDRGELHHLAVGTPGHERRFLVTGPLHAPDQLDALRQPGRSVRSSGDGAVRRRELLGRARLHGLLSLRDRLCDVYGIGHGSSVTERGAARRPPLWSA
jgi:hypothetical protein